MRDNPQLAAYHLAGLLCNCKIALLYEEIFNQRALWCPPVKEDDLWQYASELPTEHRENTYALFTRYEDNYGTLRQIARSKGFVQG
jgi:hypothetical protein